jgi:hypothetical protein
MTSLQSITWWLKNIFPTHCLNFTDDSGSNFDFFFQIKSLKETNLPDSIFVSATEVQSTAPAVINFPKHYRCSSHSLNLLGKNDVNKAIEPSVDTFFLCAYRRVMGKIRCFLTKISCSQPIADECANIFGMDYILNQLFSFIYLFLFFLWEKECPL